MARALVTADSSVVIPALLQWHPLHQQSEEALLAVRWLPAHAFAESLSVVTRLPKPRGLDAPHVYRSLLNWFPEEPVVLSPAGYLEVFRRLAAANVAGGRIYDAIVGATAAEAGVRLLSADRRATATYALVGADYELVE